MCTQILKGKKRKSSPINRLKNTTTWKEGDLKYVCTKSIHTFFSECTA